MQGKKAIIKSSFVIKSNILCPPPICFFNFVEEVNHMVGLPKIVLYVVIHSWDPEFYELIFECSRLLEETMNFAFYFHVFLFC